MGGTGIVTVEVHAVPVADVLFETYAYAPGPAGEMPPHAHSDYCLCLSPNFPGEYRYRGARHPVPVGSLSVLHPGEVHACRDPDLRPYTSVFRMIYLSPERMRRFAAELAGKDALPAEPFFPDPILTTPDTVCRFLRLHDAATGRQASRLEVDTLLLSATITLLRGHARNRTASSPEWREERAAVRRARDFLESHLAEDVSLARLSEVAGLSPYHLSRVFCAEVGLPPHAYQIQARVGRARALLLAGVPAGEAAIEAGFFDQSHLIRHFRRIVGVSPARYLAARTSYR